MAERVYRVIDRVVTWGEGYVRARSKAEAVEKAKRGLVEFTYEPGESDLAAKWLRDPREATYYDPAEAPRSDAGEPWPNDQHLGHES